MPEARRVVVLEDDTVNRSATERILRREDYWVLVTQHVGAAARLVTVSAVDLVLADLRLGCVEMVPRGRRRQVDAVFRELPAPLTDGYAVLRPLHLDPAAARFPVVTLKANGASSEPSASCRFGVVAFLPRSGEAPGLVEGLEAVFREAASPAPSAERVEAGPPPFESTPAPLRTALVVDPHDADRRAMGAELARHGFTVYEAATGADALRIAVARRPWLVLTELSLPDESGLALCRRMRGHSLLRRTPVVFVSARDDCSSRYEAMQAGADDFLGKPASSREMLIRVELLLRRFAGIEAGPESGAGLRGAVELVGAPAVLQICHLNQLTGVLVAHRGSQSVRIAFRQGQIVSATGPDHEGPQVVYDFIAWPNGLFEFDRGALVEGTAMSADFNGLLLEGCRRLDERRRGRPAESALN